MQENKLLLFEERDGDINFLGYGDIQDGIRHYGTNWVFLSLSNKDYLIDKIRLFEEENGIDVDSELPYNLEDYINLTVDAEGVNAPNVLFQELKKYGITLKEIGQTIWVDDQQREIISMSATEGIYEYNEHTTIYTVQVDDLNEQLLKAVYRDDEHIFFDIVKEHYDNLGFTEDDIEVVKRLGKVEEAIDERFGYEHSTLEQVGIIDISEDEYEHDYSNNTCEYYGKYYKC